MNRTKIFIILILSSILVISCGSPEDSVDSYLAKADAFFETEDYVSAKLEAQNAIQIDPKNVRAHLLLSKIEENKENWGPAVGHLRVAVDEDPWVLATRLKLGGIYVRAGMAAAAAEQAEVAMTLAPENAESRLLNAQALQLNQQVEAATREVDTALELDPRLATAIRFKSLLLINEGDSDAALTLIEEAIESGDQPDDLIMLREFQVGVYAALKKFEAFEAELQSMIADYPDNDEYLIALAEFYYQQGRLEETEEVFRLLVENNPTDNLERIRLVRFIQSTQGTAAAKDVLKEFIAEYPDEYSLQMILGKYSVATQSFDEAMTIYEGIASDSPNEEGRLAARNRIVLIHVRLGELESARVMIEEILSVQEDNSDALLARAAFHYAELAYEDAIADLRIVLRSDENSTRALMLLARSHVRSGNEDLAQDAYRRLIEVAPGHKTASLELAQLLAGRGDNRLAEDVLRERLASNPDDREAASGLIQAQLNQGNIDAAEETALSMQNLEDSSGRSEYQLGLVMQAKNSGEDAISAYKDALEKTPRFARALDGLIRNLIDQGRFDEAVDYLQQALVDDPDYHYPNLLLGAIYADRGDKETAESYFDALIAAKPEAVSAYRAKAALYPDIPQSRIEIFQQGLNANPKNPALTLLLAGELGLTGQYESQIILYEEALNAYPGKDAFVNNLAVLLLEHRTDQESMAKALDLAKQFRESENPAFMDTLGWAYYRNGDFLSAIPYLEKAVEGAGTVPQTHYHLGMAYFAAKDSMPAKLELETAIRLANGDFIGIEEARNALTSIEEKTASR